MKDLNRGSDAIMDDVDRHPESYEPGDEFPVGDNTVVARPDWSFYETRAPFAAGLWQYGTCPECDTRTVSQAKHAICPNCGSEVYGT